MATDAKAEPERLLSRGFTAWLGISTISTLGDGILYFAVGWSASALGGRTAGLLLTLGMLPRTVLLLVGGVVGDRWGLRRTVLACDICMVIALLAYLAGDRLNVGTVGLLGFVAVAMGATSAFRIPAADAFPRLFVGESLLSRALSLTGSVTQVARMCGPPLGGIIVVLVGMAGVVGLTMCGFALIILVLLTVKPPLEQASAPEERSTVRQIAAGVRAATHMPGVATLLLSVGLVAGSILPLLSLCVPLLARERGWGASATGLIEAAWIAGSLAVSLIVARVGTHSRPIGPMATGPILVAVGIATLATLPSIYVGVVGAIVMGVGTVTFTSHAFPLYILATPEGMLARFQALLGVVQAAPILVMNNVLGSIAEGSSTFWAMMTVAVLSLIATVALLTSSTLRTAGTNHSDHSSHEGAST